MDRCLTICVPVHIMHVGNAISTNPMTKWSFFGLTWALLRIYSFGRESKIFPPFPCDLFGIFWQKMRRFPRLLKRWIITLQRRQTGNRSQIFNHLLAFGASDAANLLFQFLFLFSKVTARLTFYLCNNLLIHFSFLCISQILLPIH